MFITSEQERFYIILKIDIFYWLVNTKRQNLMTSLKNKIIYSWQNRIGQNDLSTEKAFSNLLGGNVSITLLSTTTRQLLQREPKAFPGQPNKRISPCAPLAMSLEIRPEASSRATQYLYNSIPTPGFPAEPCKSEELGHCFTTKRKTGSPKSPTTVVLSS